MPSPPIWPFRLLLLGQRDLVHRSFGLQLCKAEEKTLLSQSANRKNECSDRLLFVLPPPRAKESGETFLMPGSHYRGSSVGPLELEHNAGVTL